MLLLTRCPNCSYKLVLLSSRPMYKCALCSRHYPEKEIEAIEFREFNKIRKIEDSEGVNKERKERLARIKEIKGSLRLLFRGTSNKTSKEHKRQLNREWSLRNKEYDLKRKRDYYSEKREILKAKAKLRRRNNPEPERQRKRLWRANNRDVVKTYGAIQHYRRRQRELALEYLKNGDFRPCKGQIFHSVPTFAPSDLLVLPLSLYTWQKSFFLMNGHSRLVTPDPISNSEVKQAHVLRRTAFIAGD